MSWSFQHIFQIIELTLNIQLCRQLDALLKDGHETNLKVILHKAIYKIILLRK